MQSIGEKGNYMEYLKIFLLKDNKWTMWQNLWAAAKAVLRGKSVALNIYIKKE